VKIPARIFAGKLQGDTQKDRCERIDSAGEMQQNLLVARGQAICC
jgi:hypothetical protein